MFAQRKKTVLQKLDKSIKQSIDFHLRETCNKLNQMDKYFTTSCCSGRVVLMTKSSEKSEKKLTGKWLLVAHDPPTISEYFREQKVEYLCGFDTTSEEKVILKYEPVVMHVACSNMDSAVALHNIVFNAGFRNSGISCDIKKTKFLVAVRCTITLEVEIGYYVDTKYFLHISEDQLLYFHNQILTKFESNFKLIKKLEEVIQDFNSSESASSK